MRLNFTKIAEKNIQELKERLGYSTNEELIQHALGAFDLLAEELAANKQIISKNKDVATAPDETILDVMA